MTVSIVAVTTTKSLFGMCNCTVDSDVGTGDFSNVQRILHVCGHAHVRLHVPQGMDCSLQLNAQRWGGLSFEEGDLFKVQKLAFCSLQLARFLSL